MNLRQNIGKFPNAFVKQSLKYTVGLLPLSLRFGKVFSETYNFLQESQWCSRNQLQECQATQLRRLLRHAYENVPYYRRIFDERNLKPNDIQHPAELSKLPYLTKQIVRDNYKDLRARNIPESEVKLISTSGSTGSPLVFAEDKYIGAVERAFIVRAFDSHGSKLFREKSTWLRSYVPKENEPIYRYEPHLKQMYLSAYHLSPETIRDYIRLIEAYQGRLLVGYPSSLYILAILGEQEGLQLTCVDVAHAGSETLLDVWKQRIEKVLGVPAKDHYGMAEKVALLHRCSHSDLYHENLEYAVVEIVDQEQDMGEVVGTSLWNYSMPFIRYRTGDRARIHRGSPSCACGRGLPLSMAKFEGRTDDIIVTPANRYIPAVNFYTLLYRIPGVKMFKIVQHSLEEIEVQIVSSAAFTRESQGLLLEGFRQRMGAETKISISHVEEIKRDERTGKIRCVESRVWSAMPEGRSSN